MARITRKELKTDRFALEVEHTVSFFEEHGKELLRYGGIALAVVALIVGYTFYARHQQSARQTALTDAIAASDAPVGAAEGAALSFPTDQAKEQETLKRFNEIVSKYSGSDEALIAQYYLGSFRAAEGNYAEAEKFLTAASQKSGDNYGSLAKLTLAQVYFGEGRAAEGEKLLRELIQTPSLFVSKDQATVTLARQLAPVKPAEARKLLEPLLKAAGSTGQVATALDGEIPR